MPACKFFTDEDVYAAVARALRSDGVDAVSAPEVRRLGETDESQLIWSATEQRVLVTFNEVTPPHGVPYYLVDERGDGRMTRQEPLDSGLRVPMWVIGTF